MQRQEMNRLYLWLLLSWVAIFAAINLIKFFLVEYSNLFRDLTLFTSTDALIAAAPIFAWLVVAVPWDKITIGPLTFERRLRSLIEDIKITKEMIDEVKPIELSPDQKETIKKTSTRAVSVTMYPDETDLEQYEKLKVFVSSTIDWRHVDYVIINDKDRNLLCTMGPRKFRNHLRNERQVFLKALRSPESREDVGYGIEFQVKLGELKSNVLAQISEQSLDWFPVVENGKFRGIINPSKLLLQDIVKVLKEGYWK